MFDNVGTKMSNASILDTLNGEKWDPTFCWRPKDAVGEFPARSVEITVGRLS